MYKNYDEIYTKIIFVCSFFFLKKDFFCLCQEDITVRTLSGSVSGTNFTSWNGYRFYSFRGIPYAEPPIGKLRFKPPVPVKPWNEIFNAKEEGPACPQEKPLNQSEDCLRLNIYTRQIKEPRTPVLVYIHGGGFNDYSGQSILHGPEYLMDHEIVLVTINYRLGTLGFFSTGDKYAAGNYGLKDQVLALKWIKNNIEFFGGDPSKITISGESAGAGSVGLHLISPMSRGLFHRAMMLSGSPINPWVLNRREKVWANKQAELLNCSTESSKSIVDCMSNVPAEDIINSYKKIIIWRTERRLNRPVIEHEDDGSERFLTKDPFISLLEGEIADVPVFIGTTKDEMRLRAINILRDEEQAEELSRNWTHLAPIIAIYEQYAPDFTDHQKLREFYLGSPDKPITMKDSLDGLGDMISDSFISFGVKRFADIASEKNKHPVYLYQFNYLGKELKPHLKYPAGDFRTNLRGKIAHADDLFYSFYCPIYYPSKLDVNSTDGQFITKFTTIWKNFVETGNPTPNASAELDDVVWESYTKENPKYLDLNENFILRDGLYNEERIKLWENLFPGPAKTKLN